VGSGDPSRSGNSNGGIEFSVDLGEGAG